jgi:hypothetical protein
MRERARSHGSLLRRIGPLFLAGALTVGGGIQSVPAAAPRISPASTDRDPIATLRPEVVAAGLDAEGTMVRRDPDVTVERVRVREGSGATETLYRVTVEGRFPPRAQRYVVLADGRPIGYGIPTATEQAVRTVTPDAGVVTEPIRVRYEGGPPQRRKAPAAELPASGSSAMPDPGADGPYEVTRAVYDLGDQAFQPSDLGAKVELAADVHYPTDLSSGPFPLVLFMHGNHSSCYRGSRSGYRWPCPDGWQALPNYAGYDYIAEPLASHGYIVVSISANGVNVLGNRVADTGMRQRGEVLERHIDLWRDWSTAGGGPFGDAFVGSVDLSLIGTMGHSRGGEGVVWHKIVDEERAEPYGIDAVLALAPVDFTRRKINETSFAVILPYCDGDVFDLQGVHYFDDSRYAVPGDATPKHTVTAFEANHNFFNTVWSPSGGFPGAFDDGRWSFCTERLTGGQQRRMGRAYIVGFFRRYLGDDLALDDMWTGVATPESIAPARTHVSYLAPDTPAHRLDLGRFTDPENLSTSQAGGAVSPEGLTFFGWCANRFRIPCMPGGVGWADIHLPGLAEAIVGWTGHGGVLRFEIPDAEKDVSGFDAFQFRAVPNPGIAPIRARFQDLNVALIDENGNTAEVTASEIGNEALAYPLTGRRRGVGHIILNQVRFPLAEFEGVDRSELEAVELRFTRTQAGVLSIADVAFSASE